MWNRLSTSPFGLYGTQQPPNQQKRCYSMGLIADLSIAPNKTFTNPNFVNKFPTKPTTNTQNTMTVQSEVKGPKGGGRRRRRKNRRNKHRKEEDKVTKEEPKCVEIVVAPIPCPLRERQVSQCDSEDSFMVVFESNTEDEDEPSNSAQTESSDDDFETINMHTKKVRFAPLKDLCEVHPMIKWSYAYQEARKGHWEVYARDRARFKRQIVKMEGIISPILNAAHRAQIYNERFM